jgi:hypothetical protein
LIQNTFISDLSFKTYEEVLSGILENDAIELLNSLPGSRTIIKPVFSFFVNFDDVWLYIYHQREYNKITNTFFAMNQALETEKWKILPFKKLWSFLGINTTYLIDVLDYKLAYTPSKFLSIEENSNGFFVNCANLFFANIFLTFAVYFVFHMLFWLTFNFKISVLFRPFTLWPTFIMMFLEGNVQYLSYLFSSEAQNFFAFNFHQKINLIFVLTVFFLVVIFCSGSMLIFKQHYGGLTKYLIDNVPINFTGIAYFVALNGYRNLFLGLLHGLLHMNYGMKITIILLVESGFMIFSWTLLRSKQCFHSKSKVWINQLTGLIRVTLVWTFLFDEQTLSTNGSVYESPHMVLIYGLIAMLLISIVTESILRFIEIK